MMMTVNERKSPPIVFVAQIDTGGDSWQPVIDRLTTSSTTITYDRPGTGNCPPRPAPNPPLPWSAFADELAALLDENGVTEPVVLVGHSIGSLIVRVFAGRYPERVAGIVHVDGSIPRLTLWPWTEHNPARDGDGPDATEFDSKNGEIEALEAAQPHVPAAVITRTPGRWIPGYEHADRFWTANQRQLARELNVPLIIADYAGHQIPDEAPALIAYVVDRVVEAVRDGRAVDLGIGDLANAGASLDVVINAPGVKPSTAPGSSDPEVTGLAL